jgi:plastocyanin
MTRLSPFLLLVCATAVVGCGGEGDGADDSIDAGTIVSFDAPPGGAGVTEVSCSGGTIAVTVTTPGNRFDPMSSTIQRGQIVRFDPAAGHDVASDSGGLFDVGFGGEGCFRFDDAGSFGFRCTPHGFRGTIVVQ